jgi:pyrophosphate--fructose-6-phosphate 1-phosphotransferase
MPNMSPLQKIRLQYKPVLPKALENCSALKAEPIGAPQPRQPEIKSLFPNTASFPTLHFKPHRVGQPAHMPLKVGVVLSGGQAPGGHNVIAGLFDALKKFNPDSHLFGFLNGPSGIVENKWIEIDEVLLSSYRNQGGFDIIGSGRTKIETPEQFRAAETTVNSFPLDGLVIIGGDDSNTNAALLAEHFIGRDCKTTVVGVPKTIDGDLKNEDIEISFGFDTACKTFCEIIGNIMRDTLSAKKYYYFIKLMGRSASHIALECALQTHPNLALIGEELAANQTTLREVTREISDLICSRANQKKDYGVILIPEGVVEFIPEFKALIGELNALLAPDQPHGKVLDEMAAREQKAAYVSRFLSPASQECFRQIPLEIQAQLLIDRDPHGNVQVSKIETERLLIEMVKAELKERKKAGAYTGKFSAQPLFCGYEGRSCLPSNFDSQYCYALGHVAALLIDSKASGYISCVKNLSQPVQEWQLAGIPLTSMMTTETRAGKVKPVIEKALVNLEGEPFVSFKKERKRWALEDDYICPGPIQFFGPPELTEAVTVTMSLI